MKHPHKTLTEAQTKVVRDGNEVHIYGTMIRSHFAPDNIEGIKVGDKVFWHITNLEQDWDVPHGLAVMGAQNAELLIMPGQTETFVWEPKIRRCISFLLYRFLLSTAPGNARIYSCISS